MSANYKEAFERFDLAAFVLPPDYEDDNERKDRESKVLLCRLFIDCFKVLTYEEYNAIQGALIVEQCWDKRQPKPVHVNGGIFRCTEEKGLTFPIMARLFKVDIEKFAALLKSAFKKLPILKTFFNRMLVEEIEAFETVPLKESSKFQIEQEKFKELSDSIRKRIIRRFDCLMYADDYHKCKYNKE